MRERAEIGGYAIIKRLGSGGMSVVFEAEDAEGHRVALKLLHPSIVDTPIGRERLRREIRMMQRVRGPYVAHVIDAEADEDEAFIVTELIDGPTLEQDVQDAGVFTGTDLVELAENLRDAVASIHEVGVLHRDIKPSNVMMAASGPILIDFGIAQVEEDQRLTMTGQLSHTPGYCDPRIFDGASPDEASDEWATVAVLCYAATGSHPFGSGTSPAVLKRVLSGDAEIQVLAPELAAAFRCALSPNEHERMSIDQLIDVIGDPSRGSYLLETKFRPPTLPPLPTMPSAFTSSTTPFSSVDPTRHVAPPGGEATLVPLPEEYEIPEPSQANTSDSDVSAGVHAPEVGATEAGEHLSADFLPTDVSLESSRADAGSGSTLTASVTPSGTIIAPTPAANNSVNSAPNQDHTQSLGTLDDDAASDYLIQTLRASQLETGTREAGGAQGTPRRLGIFERASHSEGLRNPESTHRDESNGHNLFAGTQPTNVYPTHITLPLANHTVPNSQHPQAYGQGVHPLHQPRVPGATPMLTEGSDGRHWMPHRPVEPWMMPSPQARVMVFLAGCCFAVFGFLAPGWALICYAILLVILSTAGFCAQNLRDRRLQRGRPYRGDRLGAVLRAPWYALVSTILEGTNLLLSCAVAYLAMLFFDRTFTEATTTAMGVVIVLVVSWFIGPNSAGREGARTISRLLSPTPTYRYFWWSALLVVLIIALSVLAVEPISSWAPLPEPSYFENALRL